MRNPLATDIEVSKMQLVCKYKQDHQDSDFECQSNTYSLTGHQSIEVLLQVTPKRAGNIVIEKVTWELQGQFKCELPF